MPRNPDGAVAREHTITARFSEEDRNRLKAGQTARGVTSTSVYLRSLVREDAERQAKESA